MTRETASSRNATFIASYDFVYQLRQLRTRFHHKSTYFMCRAFNEPVDDLSTRPYTLSTLADWDNGTDDAFYRTASKLFQEIGDLRADSAGKVR